MGNREFSKAFPVSLVDSEVLKKNSGTCGKSAISNDLNQIAINLVREMVSLSDQPQFSLLTAIGRTPSGRPHVFHL